MASVRQRNDRKLTKLKQESKKLHAEVEALEDALMLHQRYKHDDDNSVRGILRKEIGGAIWQHGGSGKLTSYRSAHDLEETDKVNQTPNKRRQRRNRQYESSQKENEQAKSELKGNQPVETGQSQNELVGKSVGVSVQDKNDQNGLELNRNGQSANMKMLTKEEKINSDLNSESNKFSVLKNKVIEKASVGVIRRKPSKIQPDTNSHKLPSKAYLDSNKMTNKVQTDSKSRPETQMHIDGTNMRNNVDNVQNIGRISPSNNNARDQNKNKPPSSKLKQTNIKPSQALERSRDSEVLKILSMSSSPRKSSDQELSSQSSKDLLHSSLQESKTSTKNITLKCDPPVKEWIRGLGLLEEEKYVKMFAENEIDMEEIPQLTALQLNEMGITAFGALNKILRGIKELRQKPILEKKQSVEFSLPKEQTSSHDHKSVLNDENDTRPSKLLGNELNRSQTFEERLSALNESRTNLRRSRSFVQMSSASKNFYSPSSSSNFRASVDNELNERTGVQPDNKKNDYPKSRTTDQINSESIVNNGTLKDVDPPSVAVNKINNITKVNSPLPTGEKVRTLRKRSNSPARRPASSPARRKIKPSEKPVESEIPLKKKCENSGQAREVIEGSGSGKKGSLQRPASAKSKNIPILWPRAKAAQKVDKKAKEGVAAAAKKFNEKQKQMSEKEDKHTIAKKIKKSQRDEMAARHEQRQIDEEKDDEFNDMRVDQLDREYERERLEISELDQDINKLISVTALDTNTKTEATTEFRQKEERPQRSRARSARHARQSINNPVYIEANLPDNLKPTVRSKAFHSSRQSEVKTIESQIEALQSKALSGEMVTMDLVKGLQQRLEEIEQQIKDTKPPKIRPRYRTEIKNPASMSMKGKDIKTEVDREREARLARSPDLTKASDPLKSIEIDRDDIMFDATDLIGEGTFSKVYHGVCMGTEVAIKQLKIPLTAHDKNYFAAEVSLLKEVHHPRVVQLLGVCTSDKLPVMVLEFMARGSLYFCLHDPKCESMDHAEYYRVAHDIALGMNYLHQHKPQVLHLDLKSMNVLLDISTRAKIADFGFSKFRHDADMKASKASKKKGMCGSPIWMAPELLETGEITTKADVYSFGIILWEMLTRSHPYEGCSVFQVLERVRLNKRPEIPASCPPELSTFIQKCWDHNTAKRPSFKDIILQLDKLAFPPDWRALFKEAGVPNQALEDVQSARTIISLVNNTLDLENVKTMMEDIKQSNDAIRESHDFTRETHVLTNQSNDLLRKSHDSVSQSHNFAVQSRTPQKPISSSLRKSHDSVLSPGKQSFDKVRHSGDPVFTRSSFNSSFSPSKKYFDEGENNFGASINKDIMEADNNRDSFDFKFNTKFQDLEDYTENNSDKLFQKGESSNRDMKLLIQGEDTTAEYLNYLKTSCEILSPSSESPISRKQSDRMKDFLLPDHEKPDMSGAVIETIASIPLSRSPRTYSRKSDSVVESKSYSARTSVDVDKSKPKSQDLPVKSSHDMSERSSHNMPVKSSNDMSERLAHDLPVKSSRDMSERLSHDMSVKLSPDISVRLSNDLSERSSHGLPVRSSFDKQEIQKANTESVRPVPLEKSKDEQRVENTNIPSDVGQIHRNTHQEIQKPNNEAKKTEKSHDFSAKKSHDNLMEEVRSSVGQLKRGISANQLKSKNSEAGNIRKLAKDERSFGLKVSSSKSKKDNSHNQPQAETIISQKKDERSFGLKDSSSISKKDNSHNQPQAETIISQKKIDVIETEDKFEHAYSEKQNDIDKKCEQSSVLEISVNEPNSLNENILEEMKDLHTKLRSQKNVKVEEIKNLHTKLRSKKSENQNAENVPELVKKPEIIKTATERVVAEEKDSNEIVDTRDDLDNLSVDSLDLNDSLTEDTSHVIDESLKNSAEKTNLDDRNTSRVTEMAKEPPTKIHSEEEKICDYNQSANSTNTGKNENVKTLPDLKSSLNLEIVQKYSSIRHMKNVNMIKKKVKENLNAETLKMKKSEEKQGISKEKEIKTKPSKKSKAEKKNTDSLSIAVKGSDTENLDEHNRKSIEAWVEKKVEANVTEKKQKQRKISSSSMTSHPPPIVIPDHIPIPPAPPLPIPPPVSMEKVTPPPAPPFPQEQISEPDEMSEKILVKKAEIPQAKHSDQEAILSQKLSKGDNSGPLMVKSTDLRDQKEVLQSISQPHPNQLQDLSQVNKQTYTSIADILKRAVFSRREAMGEDNYSPSPSVASSWSFVDD